MNEPAVTKMFQWSADCAVGVQQIDQEHQGLFQMFEEMHQAMLEGKGEAILQDLLSRLVNYTLHHFAHEERLMERIGYPDYRRHQIEHAELCSKVRTMQDRSDLEKVPPGEILRFLGDWLKYHTTTSDRRIGAYMKMSGADGHHGQHSSP